MIVSHSRHRFIWAVIVFGTLLLSPGLHAGEDAVAARDKVRRECLEILRRAHTSDNSFIRSAALRAAGESHDPELISLVKKGAEDIYPTARQFALQAMRELDRAEAVNLAATLLRDGDVWVRATAVEIVGESGEAAKASARIMPLLNDADPAVRLAAATALYRLGQKDQLKVLASSAGGGDPALRAQAIGYLGKLDPSDVAGTLDPLFNDADAEVVRSALKAVEEHPRPRDSGRYRELSRHADAAVRAQAALVLGHLPDEAAVASAIGRLCSDADSMVRLSAAVALAKQHRSPCRQGFESALTDPDYAVRSSAARVLGTLDVEGRAGYLARALNDSHTRVRTAAVRAVGMMGGAEAFRLLIPMLGDAQEAVRAYAAGYLIRLMR